jgi:hypothetical protein
MAQRSYDQAFDSSMMPIEGKYVVSSFLSEVSLFDDQVYLCKGSSIIHDDPVSLLDPVSGAYTTLSTNDYYVKGTAAAITSIDDCHEGSAHTVNYAVYDNDLIHSFLSISNSFSVIPNAFVAAYDGGKDFIDAMVAADPTEFTYDDTDPFVLKPIVQNSDGSFTYSFTAHFTRCHYDDIYEANRRFGFFVDLNADYSLKDYGSSVEIFDPLTDASGNITGYAADAATEVIFSGISSDSLGNYGGSLPDLVTASTNENGDALNAEGATLIATRTPHPSYDMTSLTSASLEDAAVVSSLAGALPSYLAWATKSTMDGTLANGATGAVYEEHQTKTLYQNDIVHTEGTLKESPITETTDEDTGVTTYTYGAEEDVTFASTLTLTASLISFNHEETESTVYHYADPLNGVSSLASFSYSGDYKIPEFLAWSEGDYLNASSLGESLSGLTLDAASSSIANGVLTLKGTDNASDYVITIEANQVRKVVETPSALNTVSFGESAVITKTYVLSAPELTAYGA